MHNKLIRYFIEKRWVLETHTQTATGGEIAPKIKDRAIGDNYKAEERL